MGRGGRWAGAVAVIGLVVSTAACSASAPKQQVSAASPTTTSAAELAQPGETTIAPEAETTTSSTVSSPSSTSVPATTAAPAVPRTTTVTTRPRPTTSTPAGTPTTTNPTTPAPQPQRRPPYFQNFGCRLALSDPNPPAGGSVIVYIRPDTKMEPNGRYTASASANKPSSEHSVPVYQGSLDGNGSADVSMPMPQGAPGDGVSIHVSIDPEHVDPPTPGTSAPRPPRHDCSAEVYVS